MKLGRKLLRKLGGQPSDPRRDVPSSGAAGGLVASGDAARGRGDWAAAAAAYRAALEEQPDLAAIWVQLGHAEKERGAANAALEAYGEATKLRPLEADAFVHLAHLQKRMGLVDKAILSFLHALHAGDCSPETSDELLWLINHRPRHKQRETLPALLKRAVAPLAPRKGELPLLTQLRAILTEDMAEPVSTGEQRHTLVFDISDLIAYYRNARLPTGIQRVQIETIEGAVQEGGDRDIRLCCFIDGREDWLELPLEHMRAIARLSTASGDRTAPEWVEAMDRLRLFLSLTEPFDFPQGASLINLGTSWWLQNYFLYVREAKAKRGIRYVPFVHDMIPIITPEHCVRGLTQDFISWVIGVFDHADHFLVNSDATRDDLIAVAAQLGYTVDRDDVAVIALDTDFRKPERKRLPDSALGQWSLEADDFVLFVSTIESRKGHLIAFEAWAELIARHGPSAVPKLVCVGNQGWLNSQIYQRLTDDPVLAERVTMLSRLSDEELALLYRSCRFTLYPSLYEGWGLPVTESLCYGKVPLISDAASLPQAGGDFAVYVEAGSVQSLVEAADRLMFDGAYRHTLEARIAADFKPRSWSDLARQIGQDLDRFALRDAGKPLALPNTPARIGAWHALTRNEEVRIWRGMKTAEIYRSNLGWHPPEHRGCRIKSDGAALTLPMPAHETAVRMLFQFGGDEQFPCQWTLGYGTELMSGDIGIHEDKWVSCDLPASAAPYALDIRFDALPAADGTLPTYFVRGFFLLAAEDTTARLDFIEAVALNRLDALSAFRDR
ncbi:glycosyltransferase family 4 protein [Rhizorhabdus sp. FW153]|uniref:glycosyltransferase family 4 protein n=1 Tax=Rhizorhabdus sp. FW153 TaxID=3400216 RepID=UPI003CE85A01